MLQNNLLRQTEAAEMEMNYWKQQHEQDKCQALRLYPQGFALI